MNDFTIRYLPATADQPERYFVIARTLADKPADRRLIGEAYVQVPKGPRKAAAFEKYARQHIIPAVKAQLGIA